MQDFYHPNDDAGRSANHNSYLFSDLLYSYLPVDQLFPSQAFGKSPPVLRKKCTERKP